MSAADAISPRRVAAVGTFDGVHLGHQMMIRQVCSLADEHGLSPSIFTFTRHPLSVIAPGRAPRMLTTADQRSQLIIGYGAKDVVILDFNQSLRMLSAGQFLQMLHSEYAVDMLVIGFNHRFGHDSTASFDDYCSIASSVGVTLVKAQEYTDPSLGIPINSSTIRRMISAGDIPRATRMLGHDFSVRGTVVRGHGIGHTIGFPTANVRSLMADQQIPHPGVYAGTARLHDGSIYPAMINIGINPTIGIAGQPLSVEAHVIGYSDDLYGMPIEITYIDRLRDELCFDSIDSLTAQLVRDRDRTLQIIDTTHRYHHQ